MDAALLLFAELGYHGVAVPKIAKDAGIATGSVYSYFASKDELVNELYWVWKQKLKSYYLLDFPEDSSSRDQFNFIWQRLHNFTSDFPMAFQFTEGQPHAGYLAVRCQELQEEIFEIGRSFVRNGQVQGVIRSSDPQLIVSMFCGAFIQYFKDTRAGRLQWNLDNSLRIRDMCWEAMAIHS